MNAEARGRNPYELEGLERVVAGENHSAVITLWTGLGAILSLLLTFVVGYFWKIGTKLELVIGVMAALLIASVILFFVPAQKDERWYLVCSLLNHAGIGLAVLVLLDYLGLEIRLANLALSALPAAAILFGFVLFFVSAEGDQRGVWLWAGLAALLLICAGALLKFWNERTEFWLCMGISALLSGVNVGALLWSVKAPEQRSIFKGLAFVSFLIYLLLLAVAAAALVFGTARSGGGSGNDRNKNRRGSGSSKNRGNPGGTGSRSFLGGLFSGDGRSFARTRRRFYYPFYLWYYTPSTRYASIDRMEGLSGPEREAARRKYRVRRIVVLVFVALIVAALIVLAVLGGRG